MKDLLLIVPPFATPEFQSLAAHNLQSVSRAAGFSCDIEYANISFFSSIGVIFNEFCRMNYFLLGERVFAKAAWGDDVPDQFSGNLYNYRDIYERDVSPIRFFPNNRELTLKELKAVESSALEWADEYVASLDLGQYKFVGLSSSFEQTNAAISLIKRVKYSHPDIITFIGGFNCEGIMADGMGSLDSNASFLDHIFSGESENSLIEFLNSYKNGIVPSRIISAKPITNLDDIPNLDYGDYFKCVTDRTDMSIVMETSRGCWWGEKAQCRFCGTSERICYREKSTKRILEELKAGEKWGVDYLHMADLIMPQKNLTELLPSLLSQSKKWTLYYEQKVSLTISEMELLKESGVIDIQPGLETLSTDLLKKMSKGTTLKQNIRFLRDATGVGLNVFWNIVWGIPGEKIEDYKKMNDLVPLLTHLIPPVGVFHMTLVRYSPYFKNPGTFGISDIEAIPSYQVVFPKWADTDKLAIIHRCKYERETIVDSSEVDKLMDFIEIWRGRWDSEINKPRLMMCRQGDGSVIILDTRGLEGCEIKRELSTDQITLLLTDSPYSSSLLQDWAIEHKLAIIDRGSFIPIVTIEKHMVVLT